jgi:regulator of sirC expression with transglutaminase-like and TPR domain
MTGKTGEIIALLNLIEDPDEAVYESVSSRLIEIGSEILPTLEEITESEDNPLQIERVDHIISSILLNRLEISLKEWIQTDEKSLLDASFFIHQYINRNADRNIFFFEIEKVRKSIWLELNHYLTPLEEINIFNKVLFAHLHYVTKELSQSEINDFDLGNLLNKKCSNSYPMAALFMIIAELLGIQIESVSVPKQNLLAYTDASKSDGMRSNMDILFFLDPCSGQVYSHKDIQSYLEKVNSKPSISYFNKNPRIEFVKKWLLEIAIYEKRRSSGLAFNKIMEMIKFIE